MAELITHVHVYDNRTNAHSYGPGDELPKWAAMKMGAHVFKDEEHPFPDSEYPGKPSSDEQGPPPKAGPGASRESWVAYASSVGMEPGRDSSRDQIITDLAAAGHPVDS